MDNKDKEIEALKYTIQTIAEIIYMQMPLRYQDAWLDRVKNAGIWTPDPDIEAGAKKDGNDEK